MSCTRRWSGTVCVDLLREFRRGRHVCGGQPVYCSCFEQPDEAKQERLKELSPVPSRDELLREVRATQETLKRLHDRLEKLE